MSFHSKTYYSLQKLFKIIYAIYKLARINFH